VAEIALRFALGGLIVSLFAMLGEIFRPKTFAGILGAAPSVALATLALAFALEGSAFAADECRSMRLGAIGFVVYGMACSVVVRRADIPVWLGAGLCWTVWLATSLGLWWLTTGNA
jgi:hypothetical protein